MPEMQTGVLIKLVVCLFVVCLAVQGMYFVSSVLLMRMNMPEDYRYIHYHIRIQCTLVYPKSSVQHFRSVCLQSFDNAMFFLFCSTVNKPYHSIVNRILWLAAIEIS